MLNWSQWLRQYSGRAAGEEIEVTEVPVYDRATRWSLTIIATLLDVIPAVALVLWIGQTNSSLALSFSGFLAIVLTGLSLFVYLSMDVWIGIDPTAKKAFRLYKLFGRSIYRKVYDISQFDRVTLRRRGIVYRAILV
jgi:hypothetical protein